MSQTDFMWLTKTLKLHFESLSQFGITQHQTQEGDKGVMVELYVRNDPDGNTRPMFYSSSLHNAPLTCQIH